MGCGISPTVKFSPEVAATLVDTQEDETMDGNDGNPSPLKKKVRLQHSQLGPATFRSLIWEGMEIAATDAYLTG